MQTNNNIEHSSAPDASSPIGTPSSSGTPSPICIPPSIVASDPSSPIGTPSSSGPPSPIGTPSSSGTPSSPVIHAASSPIVTPSSSGTSSPIGAPSSSGPPSPISTPSSPVIQAASATPASASSAVGAASPISIREAILLAGGLGTRLRSSVPDLPKCMAPVAGRPFIAHVIDYCLTQGIDRFIFALGYKSDYFDDFLQNTLQPHQYAISREEEPLGTGGAIRLAARQARDRHVLALNGDTFFGFDATALSASHIQNAAHCSLSLKPMREFDRYGSVELGPQNRILEFKEKQYLSEGLINAGVYALDTQAFLAENLPEKCSFEKDYLESKVHERPFYGLVRDAYFIDIGIPRDYDRAQIELA